MKSPVGELQLVASDAGLAAILWENDDPNRIRLGDRTEKKNHPVLIETEKQLREYFGGERDTFSVKLDFKGTEFQKQVWKALLTIPYGETRSYAQIAKQIGSPKAMRAVGAANGKSPRRCAVPAASIGSARTGPSCACGFP